MSDDHKIGFFAIGCAFAFLVLVAMLIFLNARANDAYDLEMVNAGYMYRHENGARIWIKSTAVELERRFKDKP